MNYLNENNFYKILVIEDNKADADLIAEYLSDNLSFKFEIIHLEDLKTAFIVLEKESFDIILLDLCLQESNGIETFNNIFYKHQSTPFIILSGLNENKVALECVKKGAQDYLIKGNFNNNILISCISYAIERKKLENKIILINENLEKIIKERTKELDDINTTLRNVLQNIQKENDKNIENIVLNIEKNILPLVHSLKNSKKFDLQIIKMLEENIDKINSNFHRSLINYKYGLTPTEIKICKLVKSGYLAKEIANILYVETNTINEHKSNIRKKLGLKNSSINLKLYLDEISPN
jgi:DNA-binding NarL/FixJ family response regulator